MSIKSASATPRRRPLNLRQYEARELEMNGRALIVREVKPQPEALSLFATAAARDSDRCPFGLVGSPLWGREAFALAGREPETVDYRGFGLFPGTDGRPSVRWYGNPVLDVIFRADGEFTSSTGVRMSWASAIHMEIEASRFPALFAESIDVKRAGDATWDELAAMGLPSGPRRVVKPYTLPIEYIELNPGGYIAEFAKIRPEAWCWFGVVKVEVQP